MRVVSSTEHSSLDVYHQKYIPKLIQQETVQLLFCVNKTSHKERTPRQEMRNGVENISFHQIHVWHFVEMFTLAINILLFWFLKGVTSWSGLSCHVYCCVKLVSWRMTSRDTWNQSRTEENRELKSHLWHSRCTTSLKITIYHDLSARHCP